MRRKVVTAFDIERSEHDPELTWISFDVGKTSYYAALDADGMVNLWRYLGYFINSAQSCTCPYCRGLTEALGKAEGEPFERVGMH